METTVAKAGYPSDPWSSVQTAPSQIRCALTYVTGFQQVGLGSGYGIETPAGNIVGDDDIAAYFDTIKDGLVNARITAFCDGVAVTRPAVILSVGYGVYALWLKQSGPALVRIQIGSDNVPIPAHDGTEWQVETDFELDAYQAPGAVKIELTVGA